MNQISAKVYYLITTGVILTITPEMQGCVQASTKKQDINNYEQLKDKKIDDIDFIELEYGTLTSTFNNVKSYSVNLKTKTLDVIYMTQVDLDVKQQQVQKEQETNSRITSISEYLNQEIPSIADIEDYILQREQNKILNGGM